ncbi:FKBP-type peptidyl-prolyl cis-trans isomerase [Lacinutrix algicola]|uniref:FKBP-type peptidyl-prolyl cis-trans isomerase n=1 Tax=Lacinutrix algicola TaxID=342954 RepID=UPI0006E3B547|nr:FKBP-type peptidyl-prolyl cis-trans isomerase [Lacinutrix algicola]
MNLRKFLIPTLSILFVGFSCGSDDDAGFETIAIRDRQEVYDENEEEIIAYFETHFFNYEDFDFTDAANPSNNEFSVILDTISLANSTQDKTPIIYYLDQAEGVYPRLDIKTVEQDDIDYKLYILKVREGEGDSVSPLDSAAMAYSGTTPDGSVFDSAVGVEEGQPFNLTAVGSVGGVVAGFKEGIVEFKTATSYIENTDGSITYKDHGIGVVFMPSGLGYFSNPVGIIPQYSPLFFNLKVISRSNTDYDLDGIPSHLEHLDGDYTEEDDDTDGDALVNFIDNDDDGDGVLTIDEVQQKEYEDDGTNQFMSKAEAQAYFTANAAIDEILISIEAEQDGTYTLHTLIVPATIVNGVSVPNYLNSDITTELE